MVEIMDGYMEFLAAKAPRVHACGLATVPTLHPRLFDFQAACTEFALRQGRCGMFLDTGLGKTAIQLVFLQHAAAATNGRALLLAPLAVGWQIVREADRFGIEARQIREQADARDGVNICNYDRMDRIDPDEFGAVSLDESRILKSFTGKTSRALINAFAGHRFRMAATATPAPNDHMELGQHAEFLGAMSSTEMLMRYFVNDSSTASQKWRLKGHARGEFWRWMAGWSRMASSPADLGFDGSRFVLPPLNAIRHRVACGSVANKDDGTLFGGGISATAMFDIKRQTTAARAEAAAAIVNGSALPWVVWCDTDAESKALAAAIDGAIEVKGSQPAEVKEERLAAFADGAARVIVTKPSVAGFGLNWQHCHNVVFAGRTFSYEAWYQAVRRCWRFGQQHDVNVHLLLAIGEDEIGRVIDRKAGDHDDMKIEMAHAMREAVTGAQVKAPYQPTHEGRMPKWFSA